MDVETTKLLIELISDAVKILGPAIITGLVAYKAGKLQLELKIKELYKTNEFKAREKIFEFHKSKLDENSSAMGALTSGLGQFAGMTLADREDEMKFNGFVNGLINVHLLSLPHEFYNVESEFEKYAGEFQEEKRHIGELRKKLQNLNKPESPEEALCIINELLTIYGYLGRCIRSLIEKEALNIFKPYTGNS